MNKFVDSTRTQSINKISAEEMKTRLTKTLILIMEQVDEKCENRLRAIELLAIMYNLMESEDQGIDPYIY